MHTIKTIFSTILVTIALSVAVAVNSTAGVIEEDDKIFLLDRTGERWDITEAVSIGFKPKGFQFGIGRHAIRPLDGSDLETNSKFDDSGARVLGVQNGADAHAYAIRKLTRHEIANTQIGDTPIAAAY